MRPLLLALVLGCGSLPGLDESTADLHESADLSPTIGSATGWVQIFMGPSGRDLRVHVEGLEASELYRLFADGIQIADFTADEEGAAQLWFSSRPRGIARALPPSVDPPTTIRLIEILDADGVVVMRGTL